MNKITQIIGIILTVAFLAACGDEAYTTNNNSPDGGTPPPEPGLPSKPEPSTAASIVLEVSSTNLGSSRSSAVELSAEVLDASHKKLEGETVEFSANGGALEVQNSGTTSSTGIAAAILSTASDPENRTITVTASINGVSSEVNVEVTGTLLTIDGDSSMVFGATTTLTIFLKDSAGDGISSKLVSISSEANNFPPQFITTGAGGQVQFDVTIEQSVDDKITVEALGAQAFHEITVSNDQFTFDANIPSEMDIDTDYNITVNWKSGGVAVPAGSVLNFSATRGTLSAPTAITDANGDAFVSIRSSSSGPVVINASATDGPAANLQSEFVALLSDSLTIQADQVTIGPNGQQSTITATIRDANNNLVKNVPVLFSIVQDVTGGNILNPISITDSLGNASTIYKSSAATSAQNGIVIRARVQDTVCDGPIPAPQLCDDIKLTVSESALFVKLGTSNLLQTKGDTDYSKEYSVRVTDAAGNGLPNATVELKLFPTFYRTGFKIWNEVDGIYDIITNFLCQSEDLNRDGNLDAGEDINGNTVLDPGNIASVTKSIVTDETGFKTIFIEYPKDHAVYVDVELTATAKVAGSEGRSVVNFTLPILLADLKKEGTVPGPSSPFGETNKCIESAEYRGATAAPPNVAVITTGTIGELSLTWTEVPATGVYKVYRSTSVGINIKNSTTYDSVTQTSLPPYLDTNLTVGTTYFYVVTALTDVAGSVTESNPSTEVNATP